MTIKRTFALQNEIPTLPIPPLTSTKAKLLDWIKPLVTIEQFQKSSEVIERFFEVGGEAEQLQKQLLEWGKNNDGNWLAPLWDDSYLQQRDALPYNVNFNILLKNDHYKNRFSIAEMAGKVSGLVAELYHAIIDEKVEAEIVNGKLLDMSQYKNFFRSVRIPKQEMDEFRAANFDKNNNHVIISYKNNLFKVHVTNDQGEIYSSVDIANVIEKKILTVQNVGNNVGIFTTANRNDAAKAYNLLKLSQNNAKILQNIADSLVFISIDEESSNSEDAIRNLMLSADNKYFDKTIQIVITKNNELGFNVEHSAVDGTSISAVISHVSKGLKKDLPQTQTFEKPYVKKQKWELNKEITDILTELHEDHLQQKSNYYLQSKIFTDFGANEIKNMRLSPDAFFHIALQLAQYRTYGKLKSVYEPVSIRSFRQGRTECARATSQEKRTFVEALDSETVGNETLYDLMQQASNAHSLRIRECQQGFGVERHMYGLEQMYYLFAKDLGFKQLPEVFQDKGYLTMRHDFISTSAMAYENVKYRMFGPVVKGGHGVAYIILDDSISINISSFTDNKSMGKRLMNNMIIALKELRMIANKQAETFEILPT